MNIPEMSMTKSREKKIDYLGKVHIAHDKITKLVATNSTGLFISHDQYDEISRNSPILVGIDLVIPISGIICLYTTINIWKSIFETTKYFVFFLFFFFVDSRETPDKLGFAAQNLPANRGYSRATFQVESEAKFLCENEKENKNSILNFDNKNCGWLRLFRYSFFWIFQKT